MYQLLDLNAIDQAQKAVDSSLLKRERLVRQARHALTAARVEESQARAAKVQAEHSLSQAEDSHRHGVAAFHRATSQGPLGGRDVLALVRYCDRMAQTVHDSRQRLEHALCRLHEHEARVAEHWQGFSRAQQRLEQVQLQGSQWRERELLARELHADLALEDDPHRGGASSCREQTAGPR